MNPIIAGIAALVVGVTTYLSEPQYELGPELVNPYAHVIPSKEPELVNPYKNISPSAVPTGLINPYTLKEETQKLMPFDSL